ncbi:hypothetical protein EYM_06350 [Ignicoccus islandicus DSM 13165]|uniref:Nucleoside phosphorylase domain-containing protein n=1 Tax=Ignicoccus islandicus DSM 13165 TaxID=940295 RepID=A0A0U3F9H8_9CREN|nr:hypothetical protein [Ignicoccus islandicus]ALU12680.1 hypothetical protein EYM_06350 [Ignicoccus islandicus DSM 13165]
MDCERLKMRTAIAIAEPNFHNLVEGLEVCSSPYSKIYENGEVAIIKTYSGHYLLDTVYMLKGLGIRNVIVIDSATSIVSNLNIGQWLPVYAATPYPKIELGEGVTPVADYRLLRAVEDLIKEENGQMVAISATTLLPLEEVIKDIELLKSIDVSLIDRSSAYLYSLCRGSIRCLVIDVVDSNLTKGVDKAKVYDEAEKYLETLQSSTKELLNQLMKIEGTELRA